LHLSENKQRLVPLTA